MEFKKMGIKFNSRTLLRGKNSLGVQVFSKGVTIKKRKNLIILDKLDIGFLKWELERFLRIEDTKKTLKKVENGI